jgi:IS5 family transposase
VAIELKLIKPQELTRVIVDSTVQHKSTADPADSRLLEAARTKLVDAAKDTGIDLKQTFTKEGKELGRKAGRYAHARQFKRMCRAIKQGVSFLRRLFCGCTRWRACQRIGKTGWAFCLFAHSLALSRALSAFGFE